MPKAEPGSLSIFSRYDEAIKPSAIGRAPELPIGTPVEPWDFDLISKREQGMPRSRLYTPYILCGASLTRPDQV
jgi:hypothetical protein